MYAGEVWATRSDLILGHVALIHSSLMQDRYEIMLRLPCRITNHKRYLTRTSRRGSFRDNIKSAISFELIFSPVSSDGLAKLQSSSDCYACRSFIQCPFLDELLMLEVPTLQRHASCGRGVHNDFLGQLVAQY